MANLSKERRDRMIAKLEELKLQHNDDASIAALNEIENALREKKYGLVWEQHSEAVDDMLKENIPVLIADPERRLCKDEDLPWNFIIEGDNLQALYLLEKTHRGKVDCIYIDPPYNTGAKDWKYNNDYVDGNDVYRHSKWLSMMKSRLVLAKQLLNPTNSVLIVTIDEKEYLRLGCLLEELFPSARIQMISSVISNNGNARALQFSRTNEFLFFVMLGDCGPEKLALEPQWLGNLKVESSKNTEGFQWGRMLRGGNSGRRNYSPGCFYPVYIDKDGIFKGLGEPLPIGVDKDTVKAPNDWIAVWPIHLDGTEGCWSCQPKLFMELYEKGFIKFGDKITDRGVRITYIQTGMRSRIESGEIKIIGREPKNGTVILDTDATVAKYIPGTQWAISSHDATYFGSKLISNIIGKQKFTFPKSLYAVHDAIRFFVASKPNAIVVDFFAGSGTTLHALNLLNAEDGGNRTCIMVTNNEISVEEEAEFEKRGIKKGDVEWEEKGIAKYVTWPRTVCTINGVDINGNALKGKYLGSDIPMENGFKSNVKFLKCGWTPRKPDDYLLSNALCLHVKELIELQTAREVDGVKQVLILSKSDYKRIFENAESAAAVEKVWVNENLTFNASEMGILREKKFRYIPREYFSQELKEVGEYV